MTEAGDVEHLPLVTLVTPSFNQGKFLEETILSVLDQDYGNIEYIIIDGGSSDGSVDIIRKYADRLAFWVSEKDRGQTHALIKGFAKAKGKYLGWICSDDVLEPSMISISVDYHKRHPEVGCTHGDRIRIDAKGNIYSLQRYPEFRDWFLRYGFGLPQETTLMKRSAFEAAGGLNPALHMAMDFDLWCRMAKQAPIRHIPAVLGRFRAHDTNKSTQFSKEASGLSTGSYFDEYMGVYRQHFGRELNIHHNTILKRIHFLLAFWDRRSVSYRSELKTSQQVRLS